MTRSGSWAMPPSASSFMVTGILSANEDPASVSDDGGREDSPGFQGVPPFAARQGHAKAQRLLNERGISYRV